MKNISIESLRSFVTIAELGSFTKAGHRLARSQSAISLQIQKLEQLIGHQVFNRNGHNFELTPSGETLMRYASQILQLNDKALADINSKKIVGKVRLGIPSEFAIALLPKTVKEFSRKNPEVTLEVTCDLSHNLNLGLRDKKYDLILSLIDEPDHTQEHYIKKDKLVWASANHYYPNYDSPIPLIVAPEGCIYRRRAIEQLNKAGIDWQIIYTIMDLSGITAAIDEGLGITVLAESTLPKNLKIIEPAQTAEPLGYIGITLINANESISEATSVLIDHLKLHLNHN